MTCRVPFALGLFFGLLIVTQSSQALTLKIATISPDGATWMNEMRKGAEEIEQRTARRVRFRFYPGGVMGSDKNVLRKIRIGQLQGGAVTGGGLGPIYFDSQIYSVPFAFRSEEEVDYVRAHMDRLIADGLLERGFVSFGIAEGGFAYLMSNAPIRDNEDLKGHKVWLPEGDRLSRAVYDAAHISPVSLPLPDVLTGLQTGLIDTIGSSPVGAIALQWHTRVKYVTDTPLLYLYGILIVDRKVFNKIDAADQAVVREVMGKVFKRLDRINREENHQAREALRKQGIEFITPAPGSEQRWNEIVAQALDHGRSDLFTPDVLATLHRYLDEYRSRH